MKHNLILTASLLGGIVLLAGCVKEKSNDDIYRPAGSEIVFGAATEYVNGDGTRTEYSGSDVTSGTTTYERINWISGDDMTIYYAIDGTNTQNAVYNVEGAGTADGKDSRVGITAASTKLTWGTANTSHRFRAVYPASAGFDGTNVSGSIPPSQTVTLNSAQSNSTQRRYLPDMSHAYMVSQLTVPQSSTTSRVDLPFTPAMTAFQFRFKVPSGQENINISSVVLSTQAVNGTTTPLTGSFRFAITGEIANVGADWTKTQAASNLSSTGTSITVSFGGNVQLKTNDYLDFTVLALPIPITGLSVQVNYADNTSKTLKLMKNNNWVQFEACKKYVITNDDVPGGEIWDYYIDPISDLTTYGHTATTSSMPFAVTSYKVKRGTTTKVPVSWTIEYSANGTSGWTTSDDGKINVNTLSGGGGSTLTVNNGANVMRDHGTGEYSGDNPDIEDNATAVLRSAEDIPTTAKDSDGYFDLSKHPVYGSGQFGTPGNMETANCYVIQRPGLYKFPLVYGNAIRNGSTNTKAYAPSITSPQGHFLSNFVRHDGNAIAGPWITTDNSISLSDAIIVWQDGTNNAAGQIIKDADVSIDGNYVKFDVKRQNIRPGNVIIAVRSGSTIVWSWHIWVTEKDLTPESVKDATDVTLSMMPYNLGWMDATSATFTAYDNWYRYVRVTQAESGNKVIFKVSQIGDIIRVDPNVGCNTFYQWGRKDPMLPATGENQDKAQYSAHNLTWESSKTHAASTGIQESIQHPNWQLVNQGSNATEAHYIGLHYGNLWDAELDNGNGNFNTFGQRQAVKTVYDPCPPGFVVPYVNAFTGFGKERGTHNIWDYLYTPKYYTFGLIDGTSLSNGWNFNDHVDGTVFFPYCGARAHNGNSTDSTNGSIYDVNNCGYYWTSCPLKYNSTANASGVQERQAAKMLIMTRDVFGDGNYNRIRPAHEQRKGAAYAVRPVLQTNF